MGNKEGRAVGISDKGRAVGIIRSLLRLQGVFLHTILRHTEPAMSGGQAWCLHAGCEGLGAPNAPGSLRQGAGVLLLSEDCWSPVLWWQGW